MNDELTRQAVFKRALQCAAESERGLVVTRTGERYHRPGCESLVDVARPEKVEPLVTTTVLRLGRMVQLTACGVCRPDAEREPEGPEDDLERAIRQCAQPDLGLAIARALFNAFDGDRDRVARTVLDVADTLDSFFPARVRQQ